jgi:hypothetical protein
MKHWTPEQTGSSFELPRILQPLAPVRDQLTVLSGLAHDKALPNGDGAGDHARASATFLTACQARKTQGADIRVGVSVDQWAAQKVGNHTRFPSLELGTDRGQLSGQCDSGYSCAYSFNVSWRSASTPMPPEVDPKLAFDRLFKDSNEKGDRSVLDAVLSDAQSLRRQISLNDRRKLDEYLDSVRDVEQRIDHAGKKGELQGWRPTLSKPDMARPADGIPQDIAEHMKLMCDILVLGFQTDTTRITTLKLNNDHSSLRFPNLGVDYMIHHLLSHSDSADWLKVNQFFVKQLAYIARKLDAVQEGERTLLDNTMLLYCSSMLNGNHEANQLPVVLVGGGGGRIRGGRVLDYKEKPNRQMCRLFLSMMDKMDVRPGSFGDGRQPLDEL